MELLTYCGRLAARLDSVMNTDGYLIAQGLRDGRVELVDDDESLIISDRESALDGMRKLFAKEWPVLRFERVMATDDFESAELQRFDWDEAELVPVQ